MTPPRGVKKKPGGRPGFFLGVVPGAVLDALELARDIDEARFQPLNVGFDAGDERDGGGGGAGHGA